MNLYHQFLKSNKQQRIELINRLKLKIPKTDVFVFDIDGTITTKQVPNLCLPLVELINQLDNPVILCSGRPFTSILFMFFDLFPKKIPLIVGENGGLYGIFFIIFIFNYFVIKKIICNF